MCIRDSFYMTDDYYIGNYNYDQTETIDEKRREIGFVARSTNTVSYTHLNVER